MSPNVEPTWFDLNTAMAYCPFSRSYIYLKLKDGSIEGRKLGKKLLVSKDSIDKMIAGLPPYESKAKKVA